MNIIKTELEDVLVIEPQVFNDKRGFFMETFHHKRYLEHGINRTFVQDNLSYSAQGTLRGLHFQVRHPQAKLIQVVTGEIFDVAVDIRPASPSFGQWVGIHLSENNQRQLYIPEGFAHGFAYSVNPPIACTNVPIFMHRMTRAASYGPIRPLVLTGRSRNRLFLIKTGIIHCLVIFLPGNSPVIKDTP